MKRLLSSLTVLALLTAPALYAQAPCALKKDINVGPGSSFPGSLTCAWGNTLFFTANDGKTGTELWKCTASGAVSMVKDIYAGTPSSSPRNLVCCWTGRRALLFFTAITPANGTELWVSNGTATGTVMVKDIRVGSLSSSPSELTCCNGRVFFRAFNSTSGHELYVSDGTPAGTVLLKDIRPGIVPGFPLHLVSCKGTLYFSADDGVNGRELWKSDGTAAGTVMVKDIQPGSHSRPESITCYGDSIVFSAFTYGFSGTGRELWISKGTAATTKLVKDIWPGKTLFGNPNSSTPTQFTRCGKNIFFLAVTPAGRELWKTDGTATGTVMVRDIYPYSGPASPPFGRSSELTCCNGTLFFIASNGVNGTELWASDGTASGTVMVKDIRPGTSSSSPFNLTCIGKGVYFQAYGPTNGAEPWFSDGTSAGTKEVCDVWPGSLNGFPSNLTVCGGKLFFTANDGKTGTELWILKQPGATKEILGQGSPPSFPTLDADKNPVIGSSITLTAACGPKGAAGFLGLSTPMALPGPLPLSPLASNWLDFRFVFIFGPFNPPGFKIGPVKVPSVPPGVKFAFQVFWANPASAGLPIFTVSNGLLLAPGN